jgi:hypothetical protein
MKIKTTVNFGTAYGSYPHCSLEVQRYPNGDIRLQLYNLDGPVATGTAQLPQHLGTDEGNISRKAEPPSSAIERGRTGPVVFQTAVGGLAVTATLIPVNGQTVVRRFVREYGTLIIESDRDDAAVKIDGEDCGNVPKIVFLSSGRHKVFLTAANAPDKTREVEIKVGYRTSVRINFAGGSPETTITKGVSSPTATPAPSAAPKHGTKPKAPAEGLLVVARPGPGYR